MRNHKVITGILFIVLILIGLSVLNAIASIRSAQEYSVARAQIGTIKQQVTNSGIVKAQNETVLKSEVSGTIVSVPVKPGQHVTSGQIIAKIDPSAAVLDYKNSQISYQKTMEPPSSSDLSLANSGLTKAYDDAYGAASGGAAGLPQIFYGLKNLLYARDGYLSGQRTENLDNTTRTYAFDSQNAYDAAASKYQDFSEKYKTMDRSAPTSTLESYFSDSHGVFKSLADALDASNKAAAFIATNHPQYGPQESGSVLNQIATWLNQVNTDISNLSSAKDSVSSASNSLSKLNKGTDPFDIRAQKNALDQKQLQLGKYTIRAPYSGTIGQIQANPHDQIGAGNAIATVFGNKKSIQTSFNEIDTAKLKVDQPVSITFDAIEGLNVPGKIASIDAGATVNQGISNFNVQILLNSNDQRIKPGMSANLAITTLEKHDVLTVPNSAIKRINGQDFVYAFRSDSMPLTSQTNPNALSSTTASSTIITSQKPMPQLVTPGASDDMNTEIISGLDRGEYVIAKASSIQKNAP